MVITTLSKRECMVITEGECMVITTLSRGNVWS